MIFRLRLRTFLIGFFVLSTLWVLITFTPLLYSTLFPPNDVQSLLRGLNGSGDTVPAFLPLVQHTVAAVGPLRRAVEVGYYSGVEMTLQHNASHKSKRLQISYLAWFVNLPKPILLVITRVQTDGADAAYRIDEGVLSSLAIGYALPLVMFGFSLFLLLRRNSPGLREESAEPADRAAPST